jgi:hypothetical protein
MNICFRENQAKEPRKRREGTDGTVRGVYPGMTTSRYHVRKLKFSVTVEGGKDKRMQ